MFKLIFYPFLFKLWLIFKLQDLVKLSLDKFKASTITIYKRIK